MSTRSILDELQHPTAVSASQKANEVDCGLAAVAGESPAPSPEYVRICDCDHHTGVCLACGWIITIGSDGREYGHRREYDDHDGCPHRSPSVDPSPGGRGVLD